MVTNGSRQNQVSYQLDGGNNVDEYTNVNQPFPMPDALAGVQRPNKQLYSRNMARTRAES